jgi:light-regulated signal transduction histidine kinase (bacteriophytochrome)
MAYALAGMLVIYGALIGVTLWQLRLRIQEVLATRSELENAYSGLEDQVRVRTSDLAAKTDELARTNQELERFAYMASHDLQEPLRKIAMMTDLLSRPAEKDGGSRERFVAAIQADAARMRDMIVGMLNLSRIGAKEVPRKRIDTALVVDEVLKGLTVSIAEAEANIVRGELPPVYANDTQMHQLFQNLIGNALKFRTDGGEKTRVEIGAERRDSVWLFHVKDNGIGLEEKYAARIFEAFERLHGKDRYAGSGLGLAICKKIVTSNGGRIWVESAPGHGATFYFTLPPAN